MPLCFSHLSQDICSSRLLLLSPPPQSRPLFKHTYQFSQAIYVFTFQNINKTSPIWTCLNQKAGRAKLLEHIFQAHLLGHSHVVILQCNNINFCKLLETSTHLGLLYLVQQFINKIVSIVIMFIKNLLSSRSSFSLRISDEW